MDKVLKDKKVFPSSSEVNLYLNQECPLPDAVWEALANALKKGEDYFHVNHLTDAQRNYLTRKGYVLTDISHTDYSGDTERRILVEIK
jgi:hypothetical protein